MDGGLVGRVAGGGRHLPDSFLATPGFSKGVAFVNGFNLGWYWPAVGPQLTLYVPGPLLKPGRNEVILLEVEAAPNDSDSAGWSELYPPDPMPPSASCCSFIFIHPVEAGRLSKDSLAITVGASQQSSTAVAAALPVCIALLC